MTYLCIVSSEANRVAKYKAFADEASANAHQALFGGQVYNNSAGTPVEHLHVSGAVVTVAAPSIPAAAVNAEWDRRVFSGFTHGGKVYSSDRDSIDNIAGTVSWAQQAISDGVEAGNLYWNAPDPLLPGPADQPFAWKAEDGSFVPMDAPAVIQLGIALAKHKQKMFLAAQALKAMDPIPSDYATNDSYWT